LENCERMTLMEIGGKLHITKERVRQLEQRAMEKMRAFSRS
jgi:DNA-directed RNA polymerase sigma subunit (sigma70/sigma32)